MFLNLLISITLITISGLSFSSQLCFDELGCFENAGPFYHTLYRPILLNPDSRATINTQFILHTRNNPTVNHFLKVGDDLALNNSNFNPEKPIKFIIHGFTDSGFRPWVKDLTKNLLLQGDYNVISVDWAGGAIMKLYMQSTANTRIVAAELTLFITYLQNKTGIEFENIHIIGHSLGAHIGGYVGEKLKKIGQISGLDPAELYFQGLDPVVRLDPSDAIFVDVIHSDAKSIFLLGLGMHDPVGHVDFYPNGGSNQPGCEKNLVTSIVGSGVGTGSFNFVACNHFRSYQYYSESVLNPDQFHAAECPNYEKFLNGKCNCGDDGEKCNVMGFHAVPKSGHELVTFYLSTSSEEPFTLYQYQVNISFSNFEETKKEQGHINLELYGNNMKKIKKIQLSKDSIIMEPNHFVTFLINQESKLEGIVKLILTWSRDSSWYNPTTWSLFKKPKVNISSIVISPISFEKSIIFCGGPAGIAVNEKMILTLC